MFNAMLEISTSVSIKAAKFKVPVVDTDKILLAIINRNNCMFNSYSKEVIEYYASKPYSDESVIFFNEFVSRCGSVNLYLLKVYCIAQLQILNSVNIQSISNTALSDISRNFLILYAYDKAFYTTLSEEFPVFKRIMQELIFSTSKRFIVGLADNLVLGRGFLTYIPLIWADKKVDNLLTDELLTGALVLINSNALNCSEEDIKEFKSMYTPNEIKKIFLPNER